MIGLVVAFHLNTAQTCRVTSIIIFVLSFIGSIILGVSGENYAFMLYGWVGSFLFCLPLYVIGEIFEKVSDIHDMQRDNEYQIQRLLRAADKDSDTPKAPPTASKSVYNPANKNPDSAYSWPD